MRARQFTTEDHTPPDAQTGASAPLRLVSGCADESTEAPGDIDTASFTIGCLGPAAFEAGERIGRYRVLRALGEGTFARVYLAHDDELDRPVAVKVPRRELLRGALGVDAYLGEARTIARLEHTGIVPVYDAGRAGHGLCYVVSKFIPGGDLAARLKEGRPGHRDAARLVARLAEALHHAHTRGVIHRDIKPANILLDAAGRPYLTDFGLALKDAEVGQGSGYAGTCAYMSPEQARGEAHRLDGRSDIFSLGVVLYELLTGQRPFRGETRNELLARIASSDPRPPRQWGATIPGELERACLKAIARPISERYTTASDMADDLRRFLRQAPEGGRDQCKNSRRAPYEITIVLEFE